MEKTALILIVFTNLFLVLILGVLSFLVYKLFKQHLSNKAGNHTTSSVAPADQRSATYHPEIVQRMMEAEKLKPKKSELFCPNHPDEPGESSCAICDHLFCRACIKPFKSLHFCKEHMPLIMRHEWDEVLILKTSTHDPEQGVRLYDIKKELFLKEQLPTYIETHYKINVDHDYIETYLVLFSMKEKVEELKKRLENFSIHE